MCRQLVASQNKHASCNYFNYTPHSVGLFTNNKLLQTKFWWQKFCKATGQILNPYNLLCNGNWEDFLGGKAAGV